VAFPVIRALADVDGWVDDDALPGDGTEDGEADDASPVDVDDDPVDAEPESLVVVEDAGVAVATPCPAATAAPRPTATATPAHRATYVSGDSEPMIDPFRRMARKRRRAH
jgi:hypothetical protein